MFRRARLIAYENGAQVNSRNRYSSKYLLSNLLVVETVAQDSGEGHCVCSLYSSKNISGKVKIRMESVTISGTLGSRSEKHIIIFSSRCRRKNVISARAVTEES